MHFNKAVTERAYDALVSEAIGEMRGKNHRPSLSWLSVLGGMLKQIKSLQ